MKFSIQTKALANALNDVAKAVEPASPVPALTSIKIEVEQDRIVMTGTSVTKTVQEILSASDPENGITVDMTGVFLIDPRYLADICKNADSDQITMERVDGPIIGIYGEKAKYRINTIDPAAFPTVAMETPDATVEVPSEKLADLIAKSAFAASTKGTRPVLDGVNLSFTGKKLTATATDSYRLACVSLDLDTSVSADCSAVVPAGDLKKILPVFREDKVKVGIAKKALRLGSANGTGKILVQLALLEGTYPNTDRLIPTVFPISCKMTKRDLLSAADRCVMLGTREVTAIKLDFSEKEVVMSARNQEVGDSTETLSVADYSGDPISLTLNTRYVIDALKAIDDEIVCVNISGEMKPLTVTGEKDSLGNVQLLLPIRTY